MQHRVGDLPLIEHVEGILAQFLYDDLGLPLKLEFDRGEEQDDQLNVAQSDDLYCKMGAVSVSELREMRFGLPEPEGQIVPRFIYTTRAGPIPLSSLLDVAGQTDAETGAPEPGAELPHKEFTPIEGVVPQPPPKVPALAERIYGVDAVPPPPPAGTVQPPASTVPAVVAKGESTGITSETGITSYDLDDEDEEDEREELAKAELAAFRRFTRARRKAGTWRDFSFTAVEPETARALNAGGRAQVAKAGASPDPKGQGSPDADPPAPPAATGWDRAGSHRRRSRRRSRHCPRRR